jgi:hypothetical protein
MCGPRDHPLADACELHRPAGVDAPGPRAVLAGDLADRGVHPERAQGRDDDRRQLLEALARPRHRTRIGARPGDRQGALVEDGRPSAGQPHHRLEPRGGGRARGALEPGGGPILLGERQLTGGAVDAERLLELPGGHAPQDRVRDRGAERRASGESLPDQAQARFVSVCLQL